MARNPAIGDLADDLRNDVVAAGYPGCEEWGAEEFLESIGDAVEKFEDEERLGIARTG